MEYQIDHGPVFTTMTVKMGRGEKIKAEAGAMVARGPTIDLQARASGKGLVGSLAAAVGARGCFSPRSRGQATCS